MSGTQIVGILFRLINFGALLWVGYMLFKRYILPMFRDQMHAKTVAIDQLHGAHRLFVKDIRDAERALTDDRHEIDRLKKRVDQWQMQAEKMRRAIEKERAERSVLTNKRLAQQLHQIQMARIFSQAIPLALERARAQLKTKFSNAQKQESYVHRVTTRIKGA